METIHDEQLGQNIIADTLALPMDLKGYQFSRRLRALFPDKAVIQTWSYSFDLSEFVADGLCVATPRPDIFHQVLVSFNGLGEGLSEEAENGWMEIEWRGLTLQVALLTWFDGSCKCAHYWILADSEATAKEFFARVCEWSAEVRGEVLVFDSARWYKDERLFNAIKSATFDNLILPPRLKQEIRDDFAQFFASREVYERYGIPWKRGVLLIGPPGNGKTHAVKALINELGVPCLYVKSFQAQHHTDQENISSVFYRARHTTPCILVLEDLDSLINDRNRSFFLNELDGFAANTGIVVLATTNHPERLDPALTNRPSRFDRKYHFELPDDEERAAFLRARNAAVEPELRISDAALLETVATTQGFSFAYLKELFLSSMMRWMARGGADSMESAVMEQCAVLREQMTAMNAVPPAEVSPGGDE